MSPPGGKGQPKAGLQRPAGFEGTPEDTAAENGVLVLDRFALGEVYHGGLPNGVGLRRGKELDLEATRGAKGGRGKSGRMRE